MGGIPKKDIPTRTAISSVISVTRLVTPRSAAETQPQKGPKRWKTSSPKPRWVTDPTRMAISWTTIAAMKVTTMKGRKKPIP